MSARLTVTLQCDLTRDERCYGLYQMGATVPAAGIGSARERAARQGWRTYTPIGDDRVLDVCPACWRHEGRKDD